MTSPGPVISWFCQAGDPQCRPTLQFPRGRISRRTKARASALGSFPGPSLKRRLPPPQLGPRSFEIGVARFGIKKILGFLETAGDFFGVLLPVLGAGLVTHCCLSSFGHRNCSAHALQRTTCAWASNWREHVRVGKALFGQYTRIAQRNPSDHEISLKSGNPTRTHFHNPGPEPYGVFTS